jgi:ferric iron reductase protein FhuF
VSRTVLEGNVTSAVAGALRMAAAARPELAEQVEAVLDALLTSEPLAGTGRRRVDGSFVRRSCCLFYRVPGAGTCGDCVLDERP